MKRCGLLILLLCLIHTTAYAACTPHNWTKPGATGTLARYFICATEVQRDALTGLNEGDMAYAVDTNSLAKATGSSTWAAIPATADVALLASSNIFTGGAQSITAPTASLGSELAPATISTSTWSVGTGYESPITGGVLNKNADGTGNANPSPAITPVAGATYRVVITFTSFSAGTVTYSLGSTAHRAQLSAAGTYTAYIVTKDTANLIITTSNTSRFVITAVSVRRWDQNTGTMTVDGLQTLNGGQSIAGRGIGVGAAPLGAIGAYYKWNAGPAMVFDRAENAGSGTFSYGGKPQVVFLGSGGTGAVRASIENGDFLTVAPIIISGQYSATVDLTTGLYNQAASGRMNLSTMLEVTTDTPNGMSLRTYNQSNALVIVDWGTGPDDPHNRPWEVGSDGRMFWSAPGTDNLTTGRPIAALTLTAAGTSCDTTAPSCTITPSDGNGAGAICAARAAAGVLQVVSLRAGGRGYTANPTVTIGNSCTGTATATLTDTCLGRGSSGELIFGCGDGTSVPAVNRLRGPNGTGSNIAAGDTIFQAGLSTGAGTIGNLIFKAAATGASGSTLHTAATHMTIGGGVVTVSALTTQGDITMPAGSQIVAAATGALTVKTAGGADLNLGVNNATKWIISNGLSGDLVPSASNTISLGASGNKVKNLFVGTTATMNAVVIDGTMDASSTTTGALTVAGGISWRKKAFADGLTAASGTPNSLCMNAATNEITVNAALSCTVSSRDFKTDIRSLHTDALTLLSHIHPVEFAYKDIPTRQRWGFIAEELQAVDARLGDAYTKTHMAQSIDTNGLLALLVKAVQEQQAAIDALKARLP